MKRYIGISIILLCCLLITSWITCTKILRVSEDLDSWEGNIEHIYKRTAAMEEVFLSSNFNDSILRNTMIDKIDSVKSEVKAIKYLANVMTYRQRSIDQGLDSLKLKINHSGNPFPNVFEGWTVPREPLKILHIPYDPVDTIILRN